jgi:GntR family transcriptional regulator
VADVKIPKYYLVKTGILELIDGLPAGTVIPTERELASRFTTSRTTVRQAVGELVAEGLLQRVQGRGTFVAAPWIMQLPQGSFSDNALAQGLVAGRRVLDLRCVPADAVVAEHLALTAGAPVTRLDALRTIDGEPLAHETVHLPGDVADPVADLGDHGSLYALMRDRLDMGVVSVEDVVQTALATDPAETRRLDVAPGVPLLVIHRTGYDADGRPVEWGRSVFRGDRFRFVSRRRLPESVTEAATGAATEKTQGEVDPEP